MRRQSKWERDREELCRKIKANPEALISNLGAGHITEHVQTEIERDLRRRIEALEQRLPPS